MYELSPKLKNWASDIDQGTIQQALKASRLDIVEGHIALMPDAHVGMGATVGSVIPTKNAVIPSAVGVDIGCGMIAARTNLSANDLPDDIERFLPDVERAIPAGVGQGHEHASDRAYTWMRNNEPHTKLEGKLSKTALEQFGTLGSGNHFFEVCLDENDGVWIVLHSGSRGIGNKLATMHINKAKQLAKDLELRLEDPDLAYFMEGTPEFAAYITDMLWAQDYAMANRAHMMDRAMKAFFAFVGTGGETERINCHHNFTQRETFMMTDVLAGMPSQIGYSLWITRKGAIKADKGDLGVIPGSMGTRSYIVEGLGNPLSWNSCSHGAGRRMSRSAAKKAFTADDLREQMAGKAWLESRAESLIDEIPSSYKDIDTVMEDQKDLVKIRHTLHQILNFKGC